MQYVIMLAIVLGLAVADFVTGIFKGYVTGQLSSSKMRKGGVIRYANSLSWLRLADLNLASGSSGNTMIANYSPLLPALLPL